MTVGVLIFLSFPICLICGDFNCAGRILSNTHLKFIAQQIKPSAPQSELNAQKWLI